MAERGQPGHPYTAVPLTPPKHCPSGCKLCPLAPLKTFLDSHSLQKSIPACGHPVTAGSRRLPPPASSRTSSPGNPQPSCKADHGASAAWCCVRPPLMNQLAVRTAGLSGPGSELKEHQISAARGCGTRARGLPPLPTAPAPAPHGSCLPPQKLKLQAGSIRRRP